MLGTEDSKLKINCSDKSSNHCMSMTLVLGLLSHVSYRIYIEFDNLERVDWPKPDHIHSKTMNWNMESYACNTRRLVAISQ
jgi:hypothetical protein